MSTQSKCRAKNPTICRFHGTQAGREAFAILMEAQTTLDMAAQLGSEAYTMAAENYAKAQLSYDATDEGMKDLEKMLANPKNDYEAMLLEQRKMYALAHIETGEEEDLLSTPEGKIVKEGHKYVKSVTEGTEQLTNFANNVKYSIMSLGMDASQYSEKVSHYERNFDFMKTSENLDNVEKQAKATERTVKLLEMKIYDQFNNAEFCTETMRQQQMSLVVAGDNNLLQIHKKDYDIVNKYRKSLEEFYTFVSKIDVNFGFRNVPADVEGLSGRANWTEDKIYKVSTQLEEGLTKLLKSLEN